jgi:hypothetical protein
MIIGTDNSGRDVRIQLDRLVESRMLESARAALIPARKHQPFEYDADPEVKRG